MVSRDPSPGPGAGGFALIAIAALLAGAAVFLWLRRGDNRTERDVQADAAAIVMTPIDAVASTPPDAASTPDDARVAVQLPDAGRPRTVDAAEPAAASDGGVDPTKQAKVLYTQAHDANQEGDFAKALELADQSIAVKSTARGHIVRAQALQRLGRIDDALRSLDTAQKLAPKYATVYEVRGNILWAARRWDDAHDAYNQYLELDQDSDRAEQIRARLEESH